MNKNILYSILIGAAAAVDHYPVRSSGEPKEKKGAKKKRPHRKRARRRNRVKKK